MRWPNYRGLNASTSSVDIERWCEEYHDAETPNKMALDEYLQDRKEQFERMADDDAYETDQEG